MLSIFKILCCFLCVLFKQVEGKIYTFDQALKKNNDMKLELPQSENNGKRQTLNKKGSATAAFDYAMRAFLNFGKNKKVLDVGGSYGDLMLYALKQSPSIYYDINDLDARHLFITAQRLFDQIQQGDIPQDAQNRVRFIAADFTQSSHIKDLDPIYDAIFIGRVFHFLTPKQMDLAIENAFSLLKSGGQVFVIAITPYVKKYEKFIPEYESRVKSGEKNPGFVKSLFPYLSDSISHTQKQNIHEGSFLFLDDKILRNAFKTKGFKILECRLMPLDHSKSWSYDGRESVVLIAQKP